MSRLFSSASATASLSDRYILPSLKRLIHAPASWTHSAAATWRGVYTTNGLGHCRLPRCNPATE